MGAAFYLEQINYPQTDLWKLSDVFPVFVVASQLPHLMQTGEFPQESFGLTPFIKAANMMVDYPEVKAPIDRFIQKWEQQGTILCPERTIFDVTNHEIASPVLTLANELYS